MQSATSCYDIPRRESQVWADWLDCERIANSSSWSSSTSSTLVDDSSLVCASSSHDGPLPLCFSFTPPSPFSGSFSTSQTSIDSASDYDELPEIPCISSASLRYHNGWNQQDANRYNPDVDNNERSFWASMVRPKAPQSSERNIAILGQMNERVLMPRRGRAPSVSSTASSRMRPTPAKSILSSNSSIRTRTGRTAQSVKFLDMPTIHYEEDECGPPPVPTITAEKRRPSFLRWFFGGRSDTNKMSKASPERPTISGPFPLWEAPPRREPGGAASLRSMKSSGSLRSVRSCGSRLQAYWSRTNGRDP
ncbi:uncharacterized protein FIBRA_00396 [Fibroporia radiculosa]|uniref:Uncharacterized protein n=1 Tax=Fibroporia radiculosa TaxID=599839 RepID=J4I7X1_9APHY|nr:uncharacterized protein FIBRA_00396 [Fibroporia radiculosa]CCL98401.1 predicted protein [Fibroporia radiculosa]